MKRKAAIITMASLLLLTGCGSNGGERVIEGDVQTIESDVQTVEPEGTQPGETDAGVNDSAQTGTEQASNSAKGYAFIYNGVTVTMDVDAAPIIEQLGEPVSYFEAASCAFEGLDKMYTYSGFELDTYPMGEADYVSSVILKDDSVSTAEGVCIGDSLEKMQQAYGSDAEESGGMTVYEKDGMKLCFILQGEEIIAIEYRSTVLEENGAGQGN